MFIKICEKCGGPVGRHTNGKELVCVDCGRTYSNEGVKT